MTKNDAVDDSWDFLKSWDKILKSQNKQNKWESITACWVICSCNPKYIPVIYRHYMQLSKYIGVRGSKDFVFVSVYMPELSWNQANTGSIHLILAQFWAITMGL